MFLFWLSITHTNIVDTHPGSLNGTEISLSIISMGYITGRNYQTTVSYVLCIISIRVDVDDEAKMESICCFL